MKNAQTYYSCQNCGTSYLKWSGKCDNCNSWNTIIEEKSDAFLIKNKKKNFTSLEFENIKNKSAQPEEIIYKSQISEFDRTLGGGLIAGSATLIGGDPGIGKSTLLLQILINLSKQNFEVAYISGEESIEQIRLRANRLNLNNISLLIANTTNTNKIINTIKKMPNLKIIVVDSIQTMFISEINGFPGTISQVRASANELIISAKNSNVALIFVGHVTKDGAIAGPRVLEHMVDTVLYFEGDRSFNYRILRSTKNRFGPTDEIGVFEMTHEGLKEIMNPSEIFLSENKEDISGIAIFAGIEGSRTVLVEIEVLISQSSLASPRRNVVGWDNNRLAMLTAVLETKCNIKLSNKDIFINVSGGLKISDPAADLAVAAAIISSINNKPILKRSVFFGEIALSSELRKVSKIDIRIRESQKLGFKNIFMPAKRSNTSNIKNENYFQIKNVDELINLFKEF